jgi:hypothetical protein
MARRCRRAAERWLMVGGSDHNEEGGPCGPLVPPLRITVTAGGSRYMAGSGTVAPDMAQCMVDGVAFSAKSYSASICELARALVAGGVADRPYQVVNTAAPGTVALRGPSIHALAAFSIEAHPERGLRFVRCRRPETGGTASCTRAECLAGGGPAGDRPETLHGKLTPEAS